MVNLEWRGIDDQKNVLKSGVIGPFLNHCENGWKMSSLGLGQLVPQWISLTSTQTSTSAIG